MVERYNGAIGVVRKIVSKQRSHWTLFHWPRRLPVAPKDQSSAATTRRTIRRLPGMTTSRHQDSSHLDEVVVFVCLDFRLTVLDDCIKNLSFSVSRQHSGQLFFDHTVQTATIDIVIKPKGRYENTSSFNVFLVEASGGA